MSQYLVLRLKDLESSGNHKSPPSPQKKQCWIPLDYSWFWLNNFDQSQERGGAFALPNPQARRSVWKKVQNSQHFISKIVGS